MNGPCIDHGKTATVGNGYAGVYAYGQRALARRFNVGQMTIHDVVHNLTWKDL